MVSSKRDREREASEGLYNLFVKLDYKRLNKDNVIFCCSSTTITLTLTTVKLGYNELGYNEQLVITNKFLGKICHFSTQMNPAKTKPGYNETRL